MAIPLLNRLRRQWREKRPTLDAIATIPSIQTVQIMARSGIDWIDPAPAIARRVVDLLGGPGSESDHAGAEMIFTSKRPHTLSQALMPFFGGRAPA